MKKHYELPVINFTGIGLDDALLASSIVEGQDNMTTRPDGWDLGGYDL